MFNGLIILVFVTGYLAITLEHKTGVNKAASALLVAVLCWALNFMRVFPHDEAVMLHMNEHLADIAQVMVFLLGAMTIVELVDSHKGFNIITDFIRTDSKRVLLWLISLATFFIRLRRIPRLFKPWMNAVKSRGASVDSAPTTCRRITPTSMAKLSKRILPYFTSRGNPGTTGCLARGAPYPRCWII